MIIKYENTRYPTSWIEYRDCNGAIEHRDSTNANWTYVKVFKDIADVRSFWQGSTDYVEVSLVYKLETSDGDWMEFREIPNTPDEWEYRSNINKTWRPYFIKAKTIKEIELAYGGVGFYMVKNTIAPMHLDPNDLQLDTKKPEGRHKCYCNWDKVWRQGCDCGGL